jgi:hypothetical protein
MSRQKLLSLPSGLEFPHTPLPHPSRFVRLLGAVILINFGAVQRLRYQFPMSNTVGSTICRSQFSSAPHHGASIIGEKALNCSYMSFYLNVDIENSAVLIHGSPKVLPFSIDRYKNIVNVKRITIAQVIPSQSQLVNKSEFDAPEPDSLTTHNRQGYRRETGGARTYTYPYISRNCELTW